MNYFFEGFRLLNKNIEIYIISLLLTLIGTFLALINNTPSSMDLLIALITLIINLIIISYSLSIPLLLTHKQEGKSLNAGYLTKVILHSLKRFFEPVTIAISIILGFVVLAGIILAFIALKPDIKSLSTSLNNLNKEWNPSYAMFTSILAVLQSIFVFSSIFFSINEQRLYTSLKMSVAYSLKHIRFVGIVAVLYVVSNSIFIYISLLPLDTNLFYVLGYASSIYIGTISTASALLYYQKNSNH